MIWKGKNKFTFQQEQLNPYLTINIASGLVKEFFEQAQTPHSGRSESTSISKCWRPLLFNRLKCNVDATFLADSNVGTIAAIIRDRSGTLIIAYARKICYSSSLVAKSLAVREGFQLANSYLCDSIVLESDNSQIIEACISGKALGEIAIILDDIKTLKELFSFYALTWTPRQGNQVAHHVAQLALAGTRNEDWLISKPQSLVQMLKADCPGASFLV